MLYASLSRVLLFRIHRVTKKETLISQGFQSGDGGIRTHGRFDPSTDFEGKESFISVT